MKFKSRADILFQIPLYGACLWFSYLIFYELTSVKEGGVNYFMVLLLSSVTLFILTIMLGTYYVLEDTHLKYRCSLIRGKIPIESIQELVVGKSMWFGIKPATARNGIIVKYGEHSEIYISPDSNESFVKKMKEVKPDVLITQSK